MMLFMSKYSKNVDFFVLIKKNFFDVFWAFYNALEIFAIVLILFSEFFEFICRNDAFDVKI